MKQTKPLTAPVLQALALSLALAGLSGPVAAQQPGASSALSAQTPEPIQDGVRLLRSGRAQSASVVFADLLRDGTFPAEASRLHYYLARSLADMELLHTAEHHYLEVIKAGPSDPYFSYALARLIDISKVTGDETTLRKVAARLDPADFPRGARSALSHLKAVQLYSKGQSAAAQKLLADVEPTSPRYAQARYLEGVILNETGRVRSAVRAFKDVAGMPEADEQIRDLSVLNIARIFYAAGEYEQARRFYTMVPRDSDYWPEALFEGAWSLYRIEDQAHTLGHLLTVESPYFTASTFNPEVKILEAITWYSMCDTAAIGQALQTFYTVNTPIHEELEATLGRYTSRESLAMADQVWQDTFGAGEAVDSALPQGFYRRLLRNHDLSGVANHLEMIDAEIAAIQAQKRTWRTALEDDLMAILQHDRDRLENRAGRLVLSEMARQEAWLSDLFMQADIIRYEASVAEYKELQDFDPSQLTTQSDETWTSSYAVDPRQVYWPFNGEFWEDELGYYVISSPSRCR